MSKALTITSLFIISLASHETARIFAWFPTPSLSHQVVFRPLTQELAKRGHQVTVVTTDPAFPAGRTPGNLTEIDVHDISYSKMREYRIGDQQETNNDNHSKIKNMFKAVTAAFESQLKTKTVKRIFKGEDSYDLLLLEACSVQCLEVTHVLKAPVILISSFGALPGQLKTFGVPFHPFLYPTPIQKRAYNLSLWEKIQELCALYKYSLMSYEFAPIVRNILNEHFNKDFPFYYDLNINVDLLLLNVHTLWSDNQPVPPGVVYIGGIHKTPRKDLPEDLKFFLDSSKRGVIYMSLGTNINPSTLPPSLIQAFTNVFSELPYDVLWKWDDDELPGFSPNIRMLKWLPQSDLLQHPNIKLFITQGGLQSIDETITAGVPVVGVPLFGDQWLNIERCVRHRVGEMLDIESLDETKLRNAIETVIGDHSYRKNMVKLRDLMNDQPMSSLDSAVWWTEYVLRHGGAKHLRSPAAHMSLMQYCELDLVVTVLAILTLTLVAAAVAVMYLMSLLKRNIKYREKFKRT